LVLQHQWQAALGYAGTLYHVPGTVVNVALPKDAPVPAAGGAAPPGAPAMGIPSPPMPVHPPPPPPRAVTPMAPIAVHAKAVVRAKDLGAKPRPPARPPKYPYSRW